MGGASVTAAVACMTCGAELRSSAKFCDECGSPIAGPDTPAEYKPHQRFCRQYQVRQGNPPRICTYSPPPSARRLVGSIARQSIARGRGGIRLYPASLSSTRASCISAGTLGVGSPVSRLIAFVAAAHPATSSGKNSITPSGCPSASATASASSSISGKPGEPGGPVLAYRPGQVLGCPIEPGDPSMTDFPKSWFGGPEKITAGVVAVDVAVVIVVTGARVPVGAPGRIPGVARAPVVIWDGPNWLGPGLGCGGQTSQPQSGGRHDRHCGNLSEFFHATFVPKRLMKVDGGRARAAGHLTPGTGGTRRTFAYVVGAKLKPVRSLASLVTSRPSRPTGFRWRSALTAGDQRILNLAHLHPQR